MTFDKNMKRNDHELLFSEKVGCSKKMVNRQFIMRFSNAEGVTTRGSILQRHRQSKHKKFKYLDQLLLNCTKK